MRTVLRLGRTLTIFVHLAYWRSETDWNINFDFSRLIGNHFCTTFENLVRFRLVIPEFYAKELVWPESIVTTVSSPMFAMGVELLGTQVISK